ncbi:MAG: hypothetical protein M5U09_06665 [Gammaproteobacteria bacterium]|nr:hypothetical protein [Gammaproteobacteria bacterium]
MTAENLPYLSRATCESLGLSAADVIEMTERLIRGAAAGACGTRPSRW